MTESEEIIKELLKFRNERDWEQFHNPKDLALAINVEAGELLELFLWKKAKEANVEKVKEELADIFAFAFIAVWGLNVMEAYVNAHFVTFDVSEDLSLSWSPTLIGYQHPGLGLRLHFN